MISEERKKAFNDGLNNIFNETIRNNNGTYEKCSQWLKNLYYRYKNDTLPEEHKLALEARLHNKNISKEEFLDTKGNIDLLLELAKSKKEPKVNSEKEEIDNQLNELEKEIISLESKITKRNKVLYRLSDEDCEETKRKIKELKEKRKELNAKLKAMEPKEEVANKESVTANKKIEELLSSNKEKDTKITELENEIAKYKEERAFYNNKYKAEYEKKFEIYSKQKDEEANERIKTEVRKGIDKATAKEEENRNVQKRHIRNLLFTNNIVSLDDIKFRLKTAGCSATKLDIAINELRNEIPGIIRVLDKDGQSVNYSLSANAANINSALKSINVCPRISNVMSGKVSYIIRADLHISLNSKESDIKKVLEPYFEFSTLNKNIPILDLGDVGDTLEEMEHCQWTSGNREAAESIYSFFRDYAKIISTVPSIKHYQQYGNHDSHAFLVGIDPVEIINSYSNNITSLGVGKGAYMIGNDKIGVLHGIDSIPCIPKKTMESFRNNLCTAIEEELPQIITDEIYTFISHYHTGLHKPLQHYSLIANNQPLLVTTEVADGQITKIYVQKLLLTKNEKTFNIDSYPIEIYDSGTQYVKKPQ